MGNKSDPIPEEMTLDEASDFWDSHSIADYPSQVVRLQVEPGERRTFVAIETYLLRQLELQAKESGVSVETLVNLWIQEKLLPVKS